MPRFTLAALLIVELSLGILLLLGHAVAVHAGEVEIVHVAFTQHHDTWQVHTTLRHEDTGWEHYADAWRVVTENGNVLGTRVLAHPHEDEQPFTRSLEGVVIPADTHIVYVEAHDKVHGWGSQRVRVDLHQAAGDRFQIKR
jgi:hypothetical protein